MPLHKVRLYIDIPVVVHAETSSDAEEFVQNNIEKIVDTEVKDFDVYYEGRVYYKEDLPKPWSASAVPYNVPDNKRIKDYINE